MGISRILLRLLGRLLLVILVAGLVLVLVEPLLIRHGLKRWLIHTAARNGSDLAITEMKGSFLRGIVLEKVSLESIRSGVRTEFHLARAEAAFNWKSIALNKGNGFFKQLTLSDVESTITFTTRSPMGRIHNSEWLPAPARLVVHRGTLSLQLDRQRTDLQGIDFQVDTAAPGTFTVERAVVGAIPGQPGQSYTFENLQGTTAFQGTRLVLADARLTPDILLKTVSTDLHNLNRGRVKVGFEFDAFSGVIRGELVNMPKENRPQYEITGSFSNIAVGQLAAFFDRGVEAGGVIDEGKFTFRGSPHALDKATFTTRLEAHDFRWGQRQWNTLALGASIVNRRIQIPELHLKQEHNLLNLKGELLLPSPEQAWWESDFSFDISARFDDLKELSALLGENPITDLSGRLTIDGNVRGQDKTFNGHLIVAGSKLVYRDTPFDLLNAGLKLDGNEVQVINLELARGRDFIRGKGSVSILGKTRYSGELQANIDKLETYRSILQKPITPWPLEGGVVLDWSGDGTVDAHSGAFTAAFRKLRTPGSEEIAATLPVDADLTGTYAPGRLSLTNCRIAHQDTSLETRLAASGSTLTIEGLRLSRKNVPWLEGRARLPINLSQWWLSPGLAAIAFEQPLTVQLLANGIKLDEVALLSGRPQPVSGLLSGSLQAEGTLRDLSMNGSLSLSRAKLPATSRTPAFENLDFHAELEGRQLTLTHFNAALGEHGGQLSATGTLDFTRLFAPTFDFTLKGEKLATAAPWEGRTNATLLFSATPEATRLSGEIALLGLDQPPLPPLEPLVARLEMTRTARTTDETDEVPMPELALPALAAPTVAQLLPWWPINPQWALDIALTTPTELKLKEGNLEVALRLTGPDRNAAGHIAYSGLPLTTPQGELNVEKATYFWSLPTATSSHFTATIALLHRKETVAYHYLTGPVDHLTSAYLTPDEMRRIPLSLGERAPAASEASPAALLQLAPPAPAETVAQ